MAAKLFNFVLAIALVGTLAFLGYRYFSSSEGQENERQRSQQADGESTDAIFREAFDAFEAEEWERAIELYGVLIEEDPASLQVWTRLAYSLQKVGNYDRAIDVNMRICEFPRARWWGLYNLAKTYAGKREYELALQYLQTFVDEGHTAPEPIREDEAFEGLLGDTYFETLAFLGTQINRRPPETQFLFIVGNWQLVNSSGESRGALELSKQRDGHVIQGEWIFGSGERESVFCYFDVSTNQWRQQMVTDSGKVTELSGNMSDERTMTLEGKLVMPDGTTRMVKHMYTAERDGDFRVQFDDTDDFGENWDTYFQATAKPKSAADSKES